MVTNVADTTEHDCPYCKCVIKTTDPGRYIASYEFYQRRGGWMGLRYCEVFKLSHSLDKAEYVARCSVLGNTEGRGDTPETAVKDLRAKVSDKGDFLGDSKIFRAS